MPTFSDLYGGVTLSHASESLCTFTYSLYTFSINDQHELFTINSQACELYKSVPTLVMYFKEYPWA